MRDDASAKEPTKGGGISGGSNDSAAKSTICLKDHLSIVARLHLSPYMGYPPRDPKGFRSRISNCRLQVGAVLVSVLE